MQNQIDAVEFGLKQLRASADEPPDASVLERLTTAVTSLQKEMKTTLTGGQLAVATMSDEDFRQSFTLKPVYIWAPHAFWPHLVGMPRCPECKSSEHVRIHDWPPRGPRQVHSFNGGFYLLAADALPGVPRGGGDKQFSPCDPAVMALYPRSVQAKFQIYVTHQAAMDLEMLSVMVFSIIQKMSLSGLAGVVNTGRDHHLSREFEYLSSVNDTNVTSIRETPLKALIYPKFEDIGFQTTAGYTVDKDGRRPYKALAGILNEMQQCVGVFVGDTSMKTVQPFLESFSAAYQQGQPRPVYIGTDLCCRADKVLLDERTFGRDVKQVHLGGWHALQRISETMPKQHPSFGDASRALSRAAMDFVLEHLVTHARVLQARRAAEHLEPLGDEELRAAALADAARRKAAFLLPGAHGDLPARDDVDRRLLEGRPRVLRRGDPRRTWDAFYQLATHILGTRPSGHQCLSTPPAMIRDGALFKTMRGGGARGQDQILATDSNIEGKHRIINNDWLTGTRYGLEAATALVVRHCQVDNQQRRRRGRTAAARRTARGAEAAISAALKGSNAVGLASCASPEAEAAALSTLTLGEEEDPEDGGGRAADANRRARRRVRRRRRRRHGSQSAQDGGDSQDASWSIDFGGERSMFEKIRVPFAEIEFESEADKELAKGHLEREPAHLPCSSWLTARGARAGREGRSASAVAAKGARDAKKGTGMISSSMPTVGRVVLSS
ncbi:RNA polymerase II transcription regulator recruiting protein [Aureococcus anophagefferens]|nr:RNA polymerase II transcription regulator recruiting protein [Aureococcus anophagefferens]